MRQSGHTSGPDEAPCCLEELDAWHCCSLVEASSCPHQSALGIAAAGHAVVGTVPVLVVEGVVVAGAIELEQGPRGTGLEGRAWLHWWCWQLVVVDSSPSHCWQDTLLQMKEV